MNPHLASRRGWALALSVLLASVAAPTWAACNGNPNARIDPTSQTVPERTGGVATTVTLDGSKSTPGNNDLLFQWTYLGSSPAGLSVTLSSSSAQKPTFSAPSVGPAGAALNFRLTVTCGTNTSTTTTTINVTDVFTNSPPVASFFISPLNATEGQTVTLNGTASSDPDGQAITYAWTQVSGAPTVTLANANSATATFTAPNVNATTTLGFRLTVSDGTLSSFTEKTVSIVWTNDPPIASLVCPGGVITADEGALVTFNGTASNDPEGGALTYAWSQDAGLPNLGIGGLITPSISFTLPHLGYNQLGGMTLKLTVTDAANASASAQCGLFIRDVTAPVVVVPADITAEATSSAGAAVTYSATSQDAVEDEFPEPLACVPPSGSTFALAALPGNALATPVACDASDAAGNSTHETFNVTVHDTTAPVITMPAAFAVEATSGSGATANFSATTLDAVDGAGNASCAPASGSTFALGDTTVTCGATDARGNAASSQAFVLSVMDTTAPTIDAHDPVGPVEATSSAGAAVDYTSPASHDAVDGAGTATCVPPSGATFALGHSTVQCDATDAHGNDAAQTSFDVEVVDTTPPVIDAHANIANVEATSAAGAVVLYTAPATADLVDGPGTATCLPGSGSTFALGLTTVTCNAQDAHHNDAIATTFTVDVVDTTPPTIDAHAAITGVEATSAAGATVNYVAPATHDLVDGDGTATCVPASGATFALGHTPVHCDATDAHGNDAVQTSFDVEVVDTTPPTIDAHAAILGVEATSAAGAPVTYTSPATHDAVDGDGTATCTPASGATFALGTHAVDCNASDAHGNDAITTHFDVQVIDSTPPTIDAHGNVGPIEATGPSGATATYTRPATHDIVDGNGLAACTPVSGATFGLGDTTVHCSATDNAGNAAVGTQFNVSVVDTTAPLIAAHGDLVIEATSAAGATVAYTAPTTSDAVDGNGVASCLQASGTVFPLGNTTVTCNATDAHGNPAIATTFKVTVRDTTPPVLQAHADVDANAPGNSSAAVTYTLPTATDLVDANVTVACLATSGSTFAVGSNTVNCTATDDYGNASTSSFHVNVNYAFTGFFKPIDNLPVVNVVKAGQAIPVKFSLGGNQGLAIFAAGYPKSIVMTCNGSVQDVVEETVTAGGSSLSYDASSGQYIYVWKTEKTWGGTCRQLQVKFADGSIKVANFNFTR